MAKQNLLIVDADPRSLKVLEVSLRKAGYSVTTCGSAEEALETVGFSKPDLILSDTRLPKMDGFEMVRRLRQSPELADIPLMFLSSDTTVESKVQGLQLGVADYLTKPIYIKEIITRVQLELQRRQREGLERRSVETKTRFSGSLADMGLVDLLQTIDISRKSGVLHLSQHGRRGGVHFVDGTIRHAHIGKLEGDAAVYRFLVWSEGEFDLEFRQTNITKPTVNMSTQGLLMEGMRRVDEWGRMLEQLPPLDSIFEIATDELTERLAEIPDEVNSLLRLFDGKRTLIEVVDERAGDDLEALTTITKLFFEGLIFDSGVRRSVGPAIEPDSSEISGRVVLPESDGEIEDNAAVVPGGHHAMSPGETAGEPARGTMPGAGEFADQDAELAADAVPLGVLVPDPGVAIPRAEPADAYGRPPASTYELPSFMSEAEPTTTTITSRIEPEPEPEPVPVVANVSARAARAIDPTPMRASGTIPGFDPRFRPSEAAVSADAALMERSVDLATGVTVDDAPVSEPSVAPVANLDENAAAPPGRSPASLATMMGLPTPVAAEPPAPEASPRTSSFPPSSEVPPRTSSFPPATDATNDPAPVAPRPNVRKSVPPGAEPAAAERASIPGSALEYDDDVGIPGLRTGSGGSKRLGIAAAVVAVLALVGYLAFGRSGSGAESTGTSGTSATADHPAGSHATGTTAATAGGGAPNAVDAGATAVVPPPVEVDAGAVDTGAVDAGASVAIAVDAGAAAVAPPSVPVAGDYAALLAEAQAARGRRAEELYRQALAVNPNGTVALVEVGFAELNRGHNVEARDLAQRATAADPTNSKAWITLGAALQGLHQNDAARAAYRTCAETAQGPFVVECRRFAR